MKRGEQKKNDASVKLPNLERHKHHAWSPSQGSTHGDTHPVVNSFKNFIIEVTSCICISNGDSLGQTETRKHVTSISNVRNEERGTSIADGTIGYGATVGIEVTRSKG